MNKIDYSKWDNIGDSSDSDGAPFEMLEGAGGEGALLQDETNLEQGGAAGAEEEEGAPEDAGGGGDEGPAGLLEEEEEEEGEGEGGPPAGGDEGGAGGGGGGGGGGPGSPERYGYDAAGRVQVDKYRDVFDERPETIPCNCPRHRAEGVGGGEGEGGGGGEGEGSGGGGGGRGGGEALPVDSRAEDEEEEDDDIPCRRNIESSGDAAFKEGDYALAIEYFTKALELDPGSAQLYNKRSVGHLTRGDLPLALRDARRCGALRPRWFRSHLQKAMALRAMSRFEQAMQACKVGLRHSPAHPALRACLQAAQRSRRVQREAHRKERKHNNELGIACCSNGCQECAALSGHRPAAGGGAAGGGGGGGGNLPGAQGTAAAEARQG